MRNLLIVVLVLAVAVSAGARSIADSYVELVAPTAIVPGETYTFAFGVYNASTDSEWITDVLLTFPDGWVIDEGSMSYVPIIPDPIRPSWDMLVPDGPTAMWLDNDEGYGELYGDEYTTVSVDVAVATQLYGTPIYWYLKGDIWGDLPHELCGCIDLQISPVEEQSWASIKALYR
ncbi:hypothetical protein KAW64_06460 [bacterium]|nr:hypothetical protein [bacterium]